MPVKNTTPAPGEINLSPVPKSFLPEIRKSGLEIILYYENITSEPRPEPYEYRAFDYYSLSQLVDGDGFFKDESTGTFSPVLPGGAILVSPGFRHAYGGFKQHFTEDSICFRGPAADALYRKGIIHDGLLFPGSERKFLPIIQYLRDFSFRSQFLAHAELLKYLLTLESAPASMDGNSSHACLQSLLELLQNSTRWWTVSEMADYCNFSTTYFRKIFQQKTGLTPQQYLDRLRLNKAVGLLCVHRQAPQRIAAQLGFADPYYFFRYFKKQTGQTPSQYRQIYDSIRS